MIVDIVNEIYTNIKISLPDVNVLSSFQPTVAKFPTVVIEEVDNSVHISSKDSGGFKYSNIAITVEIYTTGSAKMSDNKRIRNKVDEIMSDNYGMTRGQPVVIPNYLDNRIYRYKMSYTCIIDNKTKKIHRG